MIYLTGTEIVLQDIHLERERQDQKWGVQHHPDGTGYFETFSGTEFSYGDLAEAAREACDYHHSNGNDCWSLILLEETFEALAESDLKKLREELVQVAAVAVAWIEDIDSREST